MIERRPAVAELLEARGSALIVAGLGSPVYDVFAAGDHDLNFYDWGRWDLQPWSVWAWRLRSRRGR